MRQTGHAVQCDMQAAPAGPIQRSSIDRGGAAPFYPHRRDKAAGIGFARAGACARRKGYTILANLIWSGHDSYNRLFLRDRDDACASRGGAVALYIGSMAKDLPDYEVLAKYEPPVTTRVHASDGALMGEFAHERRLYLPIQAVPDRVKAAFLSAEDKNFYTHPGIDLAGLGRAIYTNLQNIGSGRRPVGASTITQQVAKNFLLSSSQTYDRKIKEMLLAFRIEQAYSKDRILELYVNEIFFGMGAYGIAGAALTYFDKSSTS